MGIYLPGTGLPRYLQEGFTLTLGDLITNRITRSNPHRHIRAGQPYVDCVGQTYVGTAQEWFRYICNAWQAGGGYPWARTAKGFVTIVQSDWHNMAASYQWYLGHGRSATYNGFQWFCGYQLAALSANGRGYYFPLAARDTDLVCFTAAPDGLYSPIEITSAQIIRWFDNVALPPGRYWAVADITPQLLGERISADPHHPQSSPVLCHDVTPPRGSAFAPRRKPFFFEYGYAFSNEFTEGLPPGAALGNFSNAYCLGAPVCYHRFFYASVRTPYSWYTAFDTPYPTQEPGPPVVCLGMANEWP